MRQLVQIDMELLREEIRRIVREEANSETAQGLRLMKGLSVPALSMKSGVSCPAIRRLESGRLKHPKPLTLQKLSRALRVEYERYVKAAVHREKP